MLSAISQGHADLADLLFLIAFIVFVIGVVITAITHPLPLISLVLYSGLALLALGWFVL